MPAKLLKCYRPDGETRGVWTSRSGPSFRKAGVIPVRASRVEVIPDGINRGRFHVDFSLLADATGDRRHRVCLHTPFDSYEAAVTAEVLYVERNWVLQEVRRVDAEDAAGLVQGTGGGAVRPPGD